MTKIQSMSAEDEKRMHEWRDTWMKIGLSTESINRERATAAVKRLYQAGGEDEPIVWHFDSPAQCLLVLALLKQSEDDNLRATLGGNLEGNLEGNLWDNLRGNLEDNLGANLGDTLGATLGDNLGANLRDNLWATLGGNLEDNLRATLWANLGATLGDNLRDNLEANLRDNLRATLGDNLRYNLWANLGANLRDNLEANLGGSLRGNLYMYTPFYGSWDAYMPAWGLFAESIGVPIDRKEHLEAFADYVRECGLCYFYKGIAIVSDRPEQIIRNDQGQLSNDKGPAMKFRDGYSVYTFNGTNLQERWITERDTIDPAEILKVEDVEQRAAGMNAIGMGRALDRLDWRIIDSDPNPLIGELIAIRFPGLPDEEWALKAQCPRNGTIVEAVVPSELEAHTVKAAHAWKAGIPASIYSYPEQRS